MHTFVVRLFVAEDVDGFDGLVEEPLTGERRKFHDAATLVAWLLAANDRHSRRSRAHERPDPTDSASDEGHEAGRS
jgi:hypothetical protein